MRIANRILGLGAVFALSLGLAACGPGTPADPVADPTISADPTPLAEPTPIETPDIRDSIASIVVDGDSVSVLTDDGTAYLDLPFENDVESVIAQLSDALRLPEARSTLPSGTCFPERPQATWGGLTIIWGSDWQRPPGAQFLVSVDAATTTNGIAITLPSGQAIGAPESEVLAAAPDAYTTDYGAWRTLHYDEASGTPTGNPDDYWGAIAVMEDGRLTTFSSPIRYFYDC
jgi:hypothetical protein